MEKLIDSGNTVKEALIKSNDGQKFAGKSLDYPRNARGFSTLQSRKSLQFLKTRLNQWFPKTLIVVYSVNSSH